MLDPTALTVVGILLTVIALVPAFLSWIEARRQRILAERVVDDTGDEPVPIDDGDGTTWRCGIYDYPPLSSWTGRDDDTPSGPLIELAHMVSSKLGKGLTFELFSYDDFYKRGAKTPDLVVGMFETKRRAARIGFSRSVYEIGLQGICRKEFAGDVLHGLREGYLKVAVYSGEVGWEFVQDELQDAVEEHRVATLVGGHQMHTMVLLKQGVYDAVIMDHLACHNFLEADDNSDKFKLAFEEPLRKYEACIAVRRDHLKDIKRINAAIVESRNTPEFLEQESKVLAGLDRIVARRGLRAR